MYQEHNRFYADWRDKKGTRKRKAFLTATDATRYELEQKAKTNPKKHGTERQSQSLSVPTIPLGSSGRNGRGHTQSTPRKRSSLKREESQQTPSRKRT